VPVRSLFCSGWFRAGVGFYNKKEFHFAIECFQRATDLDPLNYNAYQVMARACIAVNRRDDAIEALKQSVKLDVILRAHSLESPSARGCAALIH
jgi:tetratricopeptide (TPR) repeat protein